MRTPQRARIFWTLLGGYASYYLCRVNLSLAQPELARAHEWDEPTVGTIASFYYLVYAIGKLCSGVAADRLGGRVLFVIGIFGSALSNLLFPHVDTLTGLTVVWSVNAFFQSMGWGALVTIMARWYGPTEQATAMGLVATSYQLGNAAAWGLMSLLLIAMPWTALFTVPPIAFMLIGVGAWLLLRNDPRDLGLPSPHEAPTLRLHAHSSAGDRASHHEARTLARAMIRRTLLSPYMWAVCAISALLTFVRYTFINWAPTYLASQGSGEVARALESAVFPLVGCAGSILAGWYSDRFSGSRRAPIIATMCAGLAGTLVLFGFAGQSHTALTLLLLGLAGFMLYGPYSMLSGAIAIDLGSHEAAATAAGIIDGVGYLAAIASGTGMGLLIKHLGWSGSFFVLAGASAACVGIALLVWRMGPSGARA